MLREPGGGTCWHVLADPEERVLRVHRVTTAASPCAGHPGACWLWRYCRSTWRSWGDRTRDRVAVTGPVHSNISVANEAAGRLTGSNDRRSRATSGHCSRCRYSLQHVRPHLASSSGVTRVPPVGPAFESRPGSSSKSIVSQRLAGIRACGHAAVRRCRARWLRSRPAQLHVGRARRAGQMCKGSRLSQADTGHRGALPQTWAGNDRVVTRTPATPQRLRKGQTR